MKPKSVLEREAAERQRQARMQGGIDWSVCLVPGCGRTLLGSEPVVGRHDPLVHLPMCDSHALTVWQMVTRRNDDPVVILAKGDIARHRQKVFAKHDRDLTVRDQGGEGVIYFLRHTGGLIKVGWTSDFDKRLKAYGPGTVVLCHYPGTRQDETNLHRQLRPSLAKGREWYHEDKRIDLFLQDALQRYGPPLITGTYWTEPKADLAAQPRKRSA